MKHVIVLCGVLSVVAPTLARAQGANETARATNVRNSSTVSGTYGRYSQTPWFSNSAARQQLQLNDDQYNQLNRSYRQAWHRYNDGLSRLENTSQNKLTPEQRQQREGDLRSEFQKDYSVELEKIIPDPAMRQRYNQLDTQFRGYDAFNDPAIRQKLNLTPEQRRAFADYDLEWNRQLGSWRSEYPKTREIIAKRIAESQTLARERITSTLTPEQWATWNELIGKPHAFHPDTYFPTPTANEPVTGVER